jgi:hypothetical protein
MFSLLSPNPSRSSRPLQRVERFSHSTTKNALVIGLNYYNTDHFESGSVIDANKIADDLKLRFFFDVKLLTDSPAKGVSKHDVKSAFDELLEGSNYGDIMYLYFSGQSSPGIPMILSNGSMSREEIQSDLLHALPKGVTLFMMFDCSYSGGMGLRYRFDDVSSGPEKSLPNAQYRLNLQPERWVPKSKAYENLAAEETVTTVLFLSHSYKRGLMTSSYLDSLDRVYSHALSLSMLLAHLSAHYNANHCFVASTIESGQYIDLNVPIGRILSAPL